MAHDLRDRRRDRERTDDFHETLSPTMHRTYAETSSRDVAVAGTASSAQQVVRAIASVLVGLLALRFLAHLFSNDTANGFVNLMHVLTDWMTVPMQALFGTLATGTGGFFDIPAIAAAVVVVVLAWLVNMLIRSTAGETIW